MTGLKIGNGKYIYFNLLSTAMNEIINAFDGKIDRKELYERFKYDIEIANWYEENILIEKK